MVPPEGFEPSISTLKGPPADPEASGVSGGVNASAGQADAPQPGGVVRGEAEASADPSNRHSIDTSPPGSADVNEEPEP